MALLMVDQGEAVLLALLVNAGVPEDLVLRLYKNNKTPADGDTEADYTEADFTGYAHADLDGGNWVVTAGAPSEAEYAQQSFTSSANQTQQDIYGYYLTQVSSGLLMWAELFTDGPYPVANNGDVVKVTPKIQCKKAGE